MQIAVIGAGIVGVTTAFELGRDGHEVTVFEQRSAAAEEASFAPGGLIAPGLASPWPGFGEAASWWQLVMGSGPGLHLRRPLPPGAWRWLRQARRAQRRGDAQRALAPLRELALYSRARMQALCTQLQLAFDRSEGLLLLFRNEGDRQQAQPRLQRLSDAGIPFGQLDAGQARRIEPAIDAETPLAGAVLLPDDEAGNCRQLALLLRAESQRLGVEYLFNTRVAGIDAGQRPAVRVAQAGAGTSAPQHFDLVVLCAGTAGAGLLAPLGLVLPLAAVHGHSLSAAIREPMNAPRGTVVDTRHGITITRLGQRVRVSGGAELGGSGADKHPAALQALYTVLHDWFPGAANKDATVQEWKGASATLPDGPPVVGSSGKQGLWLNLGHGDMGWALACGCARALADQVLGHAGDIDMRAFDVARLAGRR